MTKKKQRSENNFISVIHCFFLVYDFTGNYNKPCLMDNLVLSDSFNDSKFKHTTKERDENVL